MRVLVACEESQAVTIELRRLGHEAYSCDLIPCSGGHPEWHIQQDVLPLLDGYAFFCTCDGALHLLMPTKIITEGVTPWVNGGCKDAHGNYRRFQGRKERDPINRAKTFPGIAAAMAKQWAGPAGREGPE